MNCMSLTSKVTWAIVLTACVAGSAIAQPAIRVEESTSSIVRRGERQPIDIQIRATPQSGVMLTTSDDDGKTSDIIEPADGSIDLRPDAFNAPKSAPLPAVTPAIQVPAETPVLTDNAVSSNTVSSNDANATGSAVNSAVAVKAPEPPVEAPEPKAVVTDEKTTTVTDADFLPPASFGDESVIMRDGQKIPLRPELLSSATLAVTVPDVFHTTLTNGMRFYHYENHDLPRVRVTFLIEAGKNADPAEKVGLAGITARTMRSGGAAGKTGDEIDRQLEQIGSDLEFNVDSDNVSGALFALTDKADEAVALLADVLMKPDFNEKKLEQQRARSLEELRRQNDEPAEISRREFRKIIYGSDHPLARTPTSASISAITRDDVRAFHDARYRPSTMWVGVSGDISQADARKLIEKAFGSWDRPPAEALVASAIDRDRDTTGGVYLTPKATAQSQIRLGHMGMERRSPKAYAVNVLNSIYGTGGFSSRLMNAVRTKHGYVYGVGGGIFSDDPVGLFAAAASSKAGTTAAAIKEILSVTQGIIDGPIGEDELETARRDIVFTFVNQFDTAAETIATHMLYDYRGYEPDYLKTFPERVRAVTAADVKAVASELLHPDQFKIYVIGNESEMDAPLSGFGLVQQWELPVYSGE